MGIMENRMETIIFLYYIGIIPMVLPACLAALRNSCGQKKVRVIPWDADDSETCLRTFWSSLLMIHDRDLCAGCVDLYEL